VLAQNSPGQWWPDQGQLGHHQQASLELNFQLQAPHQTLNTLLANSTI
jgi:hypothetical protein